MRQARLGGLPRGYLRHGGLDTRQRLMVQLAALIACPTLSEYRVMLSWALTVRVTPV
jgi:4-carboxymuconolactone decarboxylase